MATLTAGTVLADSGDTLNLFASEVVTFDNNLFRLPSGVEPSGVGNSGRADRIQTETVGVAVDKAYSLQRFQFNASLADYRFDRHGFLNFTARNGGANWAWSLTPHLTGNLSFDRRQSLNSFADFRNLRERNVNTSTQRRADIDFSPGGPWHLTLAGFWNTSENAVAFLEAQDYDSRGSEIGVRYQGADGDYLAWRLRSSRGQYPMAQLNPATLNDRGFRQEDAEILGRWMPSGHSLLTGRLTAFRRNSDNYSARDYDGTAGRFDYTWSPTAKTRFILSAAREYGSYQALDASYAITDSVSLTSNWQPGADTLVSIRVDRSHKDFCGSPGLANGARADKQRAEQISVDWAAFKVLTIGLVLRHEARRSSEAGLDYDDRSATLSTRFSY